MKKSSFLLLVFSLIVLFISCGKENASTTFRWDETGYADPWPRDSDDTDEERKESIEAYLMDKNVKAKHISFEFDVDKTQECRACYCTTGRIISIRIPLRDKEEMIALGFY